MNQTQRKFIINKIQEKIEGRKEALRNATYKKERPDPKSYLKAQLLTGTAKLKPEKEIIEAARVRAASGRMSAFTSNNTVDMPIEKMFVLPDDYYRDLEAYMTEQKAANDEYAEFLLQEETMITRVMLASDKVLVGIIDDIDKMGDLRLLNNSLKLIE